MTEDIKDKVMEEILDKGNDYQGGFTLKEIETAIDLTEKLVREECEKGFSEKIDKVVEKFKSRDFPISAFNKSMEELKQKLREAVK